jgi:MFS family permease
MLALTQSETISATETWIAAAVFLVSLALFFWVEARAIDPMISFALWRRKAIAAANGAAVLTGMVLMGLMTFLPMYVQGVLHRPPVVAGFALTMIMIGWPSGATFTARTFQRIGLRPLMVTGSFLIPAGASVFIFLGPGSSPVIAAAGSLVMGFGMGLLSVSSIMLIQEIVDWSERGSATASNLFGRNLGSTLGAAVLGAVLNYGLTHSPGVAGVTSDQLRDVIEGGANGDPAITAIRAALQDSLHMTFWAMFVIALLTILTAAFLPSIVISKPAQPREMPAE